MNSIQRTLVGLCLAALTLVGCQKVSPPLEKPALIPLPSSVELTDGAYFQLKTSSRISYSEGIERTELLTRLLQEQLKSVTKQDYSLITPDNEPGDIRLELEQGIPTEGYLLEVIPTQVSIKASNTQGFRHALQTLTQLTDRAGRIYAAKITDQPRFGYRGLMLDVSRYFVPKDEVKTLLREMAHYKLNRFHWHLVDGGGWRMESKSYPLLTQKGAWRTERDWDKWWHERDRRFVDEGEGGYGGYYTQEEIREVVAYAEELGITIVPEIELPGHSTEIAAAYPEIFCLQRFDPSITDVCIGREETFTFFEKILDETMELFPSEYIHIGGDEAAMNHWGDCPKCKERMRTEGLKDLHELQSYMIKRIERYLKSKGRKLIGWDEILMGGLAPDATVMSWRGEAGGIEAAQSGHDVIMTPNGYLYLDYYQAPAEHEPRAIGGFVSLEKVYSYDPTPSVLTQEQKRHVLGVQANLWTEYIESPEHMQYMYFPRALALAEIAWTPQQKRDYEDFRLRATRQVEQLRSRGISTYPLTGISTSVETSVANKSIALTLRAEQAPVDIRYTTDGTEPTSQSKLYTGPIVTADSALVTAALFRGSRRIEGASTHYRIDYHKAIGKPVHYAKEWNGRYPAAGDRTLVDGVRATPTYLDGMWQGFTEPMDVTIDLEEVMPIRQVFARFMQEREQWVYMPKSVEVFVSEDGKAWESLGERTTQTDESNPRPVFETFTFYTNRTARYIRMTANIGRSPGHFIFTDEIVVH
ncbi:MAG: family 20 glycosylhydrolase [Porphyromonadaceae bacterium]|nr:family 20 glycosylhydrolase [Porphyromonadaceae bacterium]